MPVEDGEWDESPRPPVVEDAGLDDAHSYGPDGVERGSTVDDTEPHRESQVDESASPDPSDDESVPEFDERHKRDFEGLLYIGHLQDEFVWFGHKFVIRTLKTGEILEVGLLHSKYVGSLSDIKAYQAAVIAACVVSVDGRPLPMPLSSKAEDTALYPRFQHVLDWHPPVLDAIYEKFLLLEARVNEVIDAMVEASK